MRVMPDELRSFPVGVALYAKDPKTESEPFQRRCDADACQAQRELGEHVERRNCRYLLCSNEGASAGSDPSLKTESAPQESIHVPQTSNIDASMSQSHCLWRPRGQTKSSTVVPRTELLRNKHKLQSHQNYIDSTTITQLAKLNVSIEV